MKPLFVSTLLALWATSGVAWAAEVRVATTQWAPYADTQAEGRGFLVELLVAGLEARGHTVTVDMLPWQRALLETERGDYDVVYPLYRTAERAQRYRYTEPVANTALAVYGRQDSPPLHEAEAELRGKRIGVVRGYANGPLIDGMEGLRLDAADDDVSNLRKLLAGRVDVVVIDDLTARFILATELRHVGNAAEQKAVLLNQKLYAAVSRKSDPTLVEELNGVFRAAAKDGTLAHINERYGLPPLETGAVEAASDGGEP